MKEASQFKKAFFTLILFFVCLDALAQKPNWQVNSNDFQYTMTMMTFLNVDGRDLESPDDMVAAFVGEECRGVATVTYQEDQDKYFAFLVIHSNEPEGEVNFKIYDSDAELIIDPIQTIEFEINKHVGNLFQAFSIAYPPLNSEAELVDFQLNNISIEDKSVIQNDIKLVVSDEVDLSQAIVSFELSNGADLLDGNKPLQSGEDTLDLSEPYALFVRSEDQSLIEQWTITLEPSSAMRLSVDENKPKGSLVYSFDQESTVTLISGDGDDNNELFDIADSLLTTKSSFNYEDLQEFRVRVRLVDNNGKETEQRLIIAIADVNEPPTSLDLDVNLIDENNSIGQIIGDFSGADEDLNDELIFSLIEGQGDEHNSLFSIDGTKLRATTSFNFEEQENYSIRVELRDKSGNALSRQFQLRINDVNDVPSMLKLSSTAVYENNIEGLIVGYFTVEDEDPNENHTYELLQENGSQQSEYFVIEDNQLIANRSFDYELNPSFNLNVRVEDSRGASLEIPVVISIIDVDESETSLVLDVTSIDENIPKNSTVGHFSVGYDAQKPKYKLVKGEGDNDNKEFKIEGNELKVKKTIDYESVAAFSIRVEFKDKAKNEIEKVFVIGVNDLNESPEQLKLSKSELPENNLIGETIGIFTTKDPDQVDNHSYSLVSGSGDDDNYVFKVVGNQLRASESFNYEIKSKYKIRAEVRDKAGEVYSKKFEIEIEDLNDPPTAILLDKNSISENNSVDSKVGKLLADDDDKNDKHVFSLVDGSGAIDNSKFAIDKDKLIALESFDFEEDQSFSIRVRVTDKEGSYYESPLEVFVENQLETSILITGYEPFSETILGYTQIQEWTVANTGEKEVEVSVEGLNTTFSISPKYFQIDKGDSVTVEVSFSPVEAKIHTQNLVFEHEFGEVVIEAKGEGMIVTAVDDDIIDSDEVLLYPNPVNEYFEIDLRLLGNQPVDIELIDSSGRSIIKETGVNQSIFEILTASYQDGIYIVKVNNEKSFITKKIIIKH